MEERAPLTEATIEALRILALEPSDYRGPPKDLDEAITDGSALNQRAARKLVIFEAVAEAYKRKRDRDAREREKQRAACELDELRRQLEAAQQEAKERPGLIKQLKGEISRLERVLRQEGAERQ